MDLENGSQYNEVKPTFTDGRRNYPFVRTNFKTWSKVFDMSVFEIDGTDEELFKSHHTMLSTRQLMAAVDSIDVEIRKRKNNYVDYLGRYISILGSAEPEKEKEKDYKETEQNKKKSKANDFAVHNIPKSVARQSFKPPQQFIEKELKEYDSFAKLFYKDETSKYYDKAKTFIRAVLTQSEATHNSLGRTAEKRVKHLYEMHFKFSLAASCVIFLFIGAPMGAIVRKGGFGYPIIISIIFFMLFITLNIMCKKLSESHTLPTVLAAWLPCLILLPIGITLTIKAMNDSQIPNVIEIVKHLFQRKKVEPTS